MTKVKRLIKHFIPAHYNLTLAINQTADTFSGLVDIEGIAKEDFIMLHAKDLTISNININGKKADWSISGDELKIKLPKNVVGEIIATISFSGKITDAMHGLYPSYYKHNGKTKKIYATQFESHHAREVFPCVDEPEAKATFDITLETDENQTALSNQPIKWQKTENGRLLTKFETTPKMSTYLVALAAGEMIEKSGQTKDGVSVTVYASPAQPLSSLGFALENAIKLIEFYNKYFDTPYPLKKSDQLALPDFSSGAMENWGLITYRESALLTEESGDISSKQYIAKVIAHELSHQWFGNLVTMKWWDDLWLNESFANMMEYLAVDALYPDWKIWQDFSNIEIPYALKRDSLDGVQSVRTDVNHPDEISTLFDSAIVYAKGGHLLYMVKNYIGEDDFKKGLRQYFKKYAYKNTVGDDLWNKLSKASGKNITGLMNTWIDQAGFPVVTATETNDTVSLKQEQFFTGTHKPSNKLWPIPLDSTNKHAPALMPEKNISFKKSNDLFILNQNNASHFITNYSPKLRQEILTAIEKNQLSDNFKIQFLNETMLLASAGYLSQVDLINTLSAFKHEANNQVWDILAGLLASLRKFVADDKEAEKALKELGYDLAKTEFARLGIEAKKDEPDNDVKLRSTLLSIILYSDHQQTIDEVALIAKNSPETIDPEIRDLILAGAIKNASNNELFNKLLLLYPIAHDPNLRNDILSGLVSTKKPENIKLLLEKIKDKDFSRPQDLAFWFVRLLQNKHATDLTWDWLRSNWGWIEETFKGDKSYDEYPRYATIGLSTKDHLNQYEEFFEPLKEDPALMRVINLGKVDLEAKVKLIEDNKQAVREKLLSLD